LTVVDVIESVNGCASWDKSTPLWCPNLLGLWTDVVMVERYGNVVFYGDIQTPAVKARNSSSIRWALGILGLPVLDQHRHG